MKGGLVLMIAGAWVVTQVLGGNALGRLGISGAPTTPGKGGGSASATGAAVALPAPYTTPGVGTMHR